MSIRTDERLQHAAAIDSAEHNRIVPAPPLLARLMASAVTRLLRKLRRMVPS
jgi:hypothetical protein